MWLNSLRELRGDPYGKLDSDDLVDVARASTQTETHLGEVKRAIEEHPRRP